MAARCTDDFKVRHGEKGGNLELLKDASLQEKEKKK